MYPVYSKSFNAVSTTRDPEKDYQQEELGWQWYDPKEDSLPVNFCLDTSLHGLQYLGQRKRHLFERIVWLIVVIAAIAAATYLIWRMYDDNKQQPIITVFNPKEMRIDEIPFPAVTICNVNNLQKSHIEDLVYEAKRGSILGQEPNDTILRMYAELADTLHICENAETFSEKFLKHSFIGGFLEIAKELLFSHKHSFEKYISPIETLRKYSQPCSEMILYCIWADEAQNCTDLFQPVETDSGYCCTFNMIPVSLLLNKTDSRDDPKRVSEWKKEDITYDNLLFTKKSENRTFPHRQLYPGRHGGLSILLDPNLSEYYCTSTDSKGFIVSLHAPLDFPRMKDTGIAVPIDSEMMINVRPQVTMTHSSVFDVKKEKRGCLFDKDFILPHYTKYSTSNCMDECIAFRTNQNCGCKRYYMPRNSSHRLCRPTEYNCTNEERKTIYQTGLEKACLYCLPTCTEIDYQAEISSLSTRERNVESLFNNLNHRLFHKHQGTILHIYFGVDSTFPRLRTEKNSILGLISDAGGILGLSLGFSVLSVLEIIYYVTIRLGCNWYRGRLVERNNAAKMEVELFNSHMKHGGWMPRPEPFYRKDMSIGDVQRNNGKTKSNNMPQMFQNTWNYNNQKDMSVFSRMNEGRNFYH